MSDSVQLTALTVEAEETGHNYSSLVSPFLEYYNCIVAALSLNFAGFVCSVLRWHCELCNLFELVAGPKTI